MNQLSETIVYKGEVYDKSDPFGSLWYYTLLFGIPIIIICLLIVSFFTNEEISQSPFLKLFFYLAIIPIIILGFLRFKNSSQSIGRINLITVKENHIEFLEENIEFDKIEKIIVRIWSSSFTDLFTANNYLRIDTKKYTYELALVIRDRTKVDEVELMVKYFKHKAVNVVYKRKL